MILWSLEKGSKRTILSDFIASSYSLVFFATVSNISVVKSFACSLSSNSL